jgi:hypothetical protein
MFASTVFWTRGLENQRRRSSLICNLINFVLYFTIFFYFNFSLDLDKKVFMDRHGIPALLRAVAATKPAEIRGVEEGVTDVGTNARLHENKTKKQLISNEFFFIQRHMNQ